MNIGPILRAMKHNRTRVVLIVLEIAMTLAIVTNCVNVILAERSKMSQTSGFDDDNIVWMNVRAFAPEFRETGYQDTMTDADLRRIHAIPGVRAATNTNFQLWEGGGSSTTIFGIGQATEPITSQIYYATTNILPTLGAKLVAGRGFREGDHGVGTQPDPATVAILSKSVADALFPDGQAVGRSIQQGKPGDTYQDPKMVIGVIEDFYNPYGRPNDPAALSNRGVFMPARVASYSRGTVSFLIRTEPGAMQSVIAEVEKQLTAANPNRVFEFKSTSEKHSRWFSGSKIVVTTMTCIIVALIGVTALGLLGLTSLAVAERTKQIGTRRALGATRADILRHFLIENWIMTTAGLVLGVAATYGLNYLLVSHVTDVKMSWQLVIAGIVLLWINGLVATLPPAMRATRVAPSIATRSV